MTQRTRFRDRYNAIDIIAVVVLGLLFAGYLYNLTGWLVYDDEGEYLYQVWRMADGLLPYRDFLTPQLPVFLYSGTALMALGGSSLWLMRFFSVLLAFGTAIMVLIYGRKHHHSLTGLLAAVLFLVHTDVFKETRIFRNEPLFLFLITAGLVAATWHSADKRRRQLLIAGIFFGLATMVKLFGLLPAAGIAAWLLWDSWRYKKPIKNFIGAVLWLSLPLILVVAVITLLFSFISPEFFDLVLGHHLTQGSEQSVITVLSDKMDLFTSYFRKNPLFLLLAILSGLTGVFKSDYRERWFWQFPTVLAFFFLSRDLGQRHFMYLLPTISLMVGWLLSSGVRGEFKWWGRLASAAALLIIIVLWIGPNVDRASWIDTITDAVVAEIDASSTEGSAILSDDIGLAFYARRPTTYSGAAISQGATTSGQITGEKLISEIVQDDVEIVIVDESLITGDHMIMLADYPRFHRFLENNFNYRRNIWREYENLAIWVRKTDQEWLVKDTLKIDNHLTDSPWFGDSIQLEGYSIEEAEISPGETIHLTLFWNSHGPADNYWSVFTHLVGPDGALVAQHDKVPYEGVYPPNRWSPDQIIDDNYQINVPEEAEPGQYELIIGMYDHLTGDRLQLRSANGTSIQDNLIKLPTKIIVEDG